MCQGVQSTLYTQDKRVKSQRILGISARFGGGQSPSHLCQLCAKDVKTSVKRLKSAKLATSKAKCYSTLPKLPKRKRDDKTRILAVGYGSPKKLRYAARCKVKN